MIKFAKDFAIICLALYFYFAVLFISGFIITWAVIRISTSVFGLPLTDSLIYLSTGIVFLSVASIDLYFVNKNRWSFATVILLVPLILYKYIKSIVKKTPFTFDAAQAPNVYQKLGDSFNNISKPIRKHFS
ncbi:MAG: hypothetical protein FWH46_03050 [Methanimicrococcus sp.]|nr:hypothetical protein [Methanimicrococcus sp.]